LAEKWGLRPFLGRWGLGPHLPQSYLGTYLRTKWHLDASSRLPFFLGVAGLPSNTKWPGPRKTSIPS